MKPLKVNHKELERFCPESKYKSKCPKCSNGLLLMRRNPSTSRLENFDHCISCGQTFLYLDIDDLRKAEGDSEEISTE